MSDFAITPDFVFSPETEFKTIESEMENGAKQYRSKWPTGKQTWNLVFKNRTLVEARLVKLFFETKKGKATSFTWTCPTDSTEYTVRFKQDRFAYAYNSYNLCDYELLFEEDVS
jgi:phage-related protein